MIKRTKLIIIIIAIKKNEKTYDWYSWSYTLPKFNIAAEKLASQSESSLPTTICQGLC